MVNFFPSFYKEGLGVVNFMSQQNTIKFEIVTPERVVLKDSVVQVTAPTKNGEITVLPNHIPLVASLQPGVIEVKKENGAIEIIAVSGGFIEVLKNKVVILADTAERAEELDEKRIEAARQKAEDIKKEIKHYDAEQFAGITAQLEKELARSRAVKKWRKIKSI
jgi:F-type H+-transporting ATPase subunit epsilon